MPRRYSATMPFRRFEPGTPRPTQGQLQAARELLERELLETDESLMSTVRLLPAIV